MGKEVKVKMLDTNRLKVEVGRLDSDIGYLLSVSSI